MTFGQPSGPPASARELRELLGLVQDAGHADFRDARGALGFTQRQAGGKFTRDEAAAYIEQLQAAAESGTPTPAVPVKRVEPGDRALRAMPSERLAAELQRRGWVVMEPS
jgi:hypothetical protein